MTFDFDIDKIDTELARRSLIEFTKYTKPDYKVNWHHDLLAKKLDDMVDGKLRKLIVMMPPRHGKTELVSRRFPAYLLGRNPNNRIIATSYAADVASLINRDVQRIIDNDHYRELFPATTLNSKNIRSTSKGSYLRNNDIFEVVDHVGMYKSAGIAGQITSLGGDFLIIDDYCKSWQDATSETIRRRNYDWYLSTFLTRAEEDARVLITATRWHEDDLIGKVLKDDPDFEVIKMPAINENNEALWPGKYDIEHLKKTKQRMGTKVFSSLYQQSPTIIGGSLVKPSWFKYYNKSILNHGYQYISSWDIAESGRGDYTVGQVWAKAGHNYYLVDMYRDKIETPEAVRVIENMHNKHPLIQNNLIENGGGGLAVYQHLKERDNIPGLNTFKPRESKGLRLQRVAPYIEAGNIFLPESSEMTDDFVYEVCSFGSTKYDDITDSFTQAILQGFGHEAHSYLVVDEDREDLSEYYNMY